MVIFPRAKINLGLKISKKRVDGFHEIETVFYPVGLCDALELVPKNGRSINDTFVMTGLDPGGKKDDNLVLKAVRRFREEYPVPFLNIHLHKAIPSGAGLGGGSSDAAFMLNAVDRLFGYNLSSEKIKVMAMDLGSDCPFFVECKPALAAGRGEILTNVDNLLEGYWLVVLNPGIPIGTKEAYSNCIPGGQGMRPATIINSPPNRWRGALFNDFERTIFPAHPEIRELRDKLYEDGAVYSSMSGSGSSVYGIFETGLPSLRTDLKKHLVFNGWA